MAEKNTIARVIVFSALILSAAFSIAQEKAGGTVVYADGREFTVVRAGAVTRFPLNEDKHLGFQIKDGDLLQTGESTFVEVQLAPKGTMLKIAENSSFVFQGIGNGETKLNLLYGRVRAKVAKMAGSESFTIRSRTTAAGVRGTDFGFDSILSQAASSGASSSAAAVRVYAFEGEVAVAPVVSDTAAPTALVAVRAGELVAVDAAAAFPLVERRALDADVKAYWSLNDFKGNPPIAAPVGADLSAAAPAQPAPAPAAAVEQKKPASEVRISPVDFRPYKEALLGRNIAIGASLGLNLLGLALEIVGASFNSSGSTEAGFRLMAGGGIVIGASALTLISTFFIPSP